MFECIMMHSPHKISCYSQETKNLLENLMKTIKLSTKQRKLIYDNINNGKPMPIISTRAPVYQPLCINVQYVSKRAKKRTKNDIINCGAYDAEKFIPTKSTIDREKEKEKLRNIFSEIDQIEDEKPKPSNKRKFSVGDRIEELMKEVEERIEFLRIMEELGYKHKYEFDISLEISEKLRYLDKLSKEKQNFNF